MKKWRLRIKSVFLLVCCYCYCLIRGRADKKITDPKKILVVQMAKLGDMVCTTPVLRAVKAKYPQSEVYVLGDAVNKILLQNHPDVDGYIVFGDNLFRFIKELRKIKFDFACVAVPDFDSLAIIYLSGIPLICVPKITDGYSPYNTRPFRLASKLVVTRNYGLEKYAPREYLKLLEPIDIYTDDTKKWLAYSSWAKKKVDEFFIDRAIDKSSDFIIGLSPAAGNKIKLWSPKKFADLINHICHHWQAKIIIIGASADTPLANEVVSHLNQENQVINTVGVFNLDELKVLMAQMSMFISVDTGPIYVAEAFEVPTIDIVGPVDERVQPPQGQFNKIVKVERKKAEMYILNSRDYNYQEAKRQVDEISVEMVVEQFEQLVSAINTVGNRTRAKPRVLT
ncbi:MAG: glycosyltransferase family 9 protein [Patescibacteria group bacterium]